MIQQSATSTERVTCDVIGRKKLLAEITPDGISVWCRICHTAHVIRREVVMAAWEKGQSVQCVAPGEQVR